MGVTFIKFLGTAGARFVVAKQLRSSAGIYVEADAQRIIIDPGPGTLVKCAKSRPVIDVTRLDGIILTHIHIDHSNDVNVLIDAMTAGGWNKRGVLFAPRDCLEGESAIVLKYLRGFLEKIVILEEKKDYVLGNLNFSTSIRHRHSVETYGIIFKIRGKRVSFITDTQYFPDLVDSYRGSSLLVINVVRYPCDKSGKIMHICFEDAKQIIKDIRPEKAILTHFGMTMLKAKPYKVAKRLSEELGIEVIAASDGMKIEL